MPALPNAVLVLHNSVSNESPADARDVLEQVRVVREAIGALGLSTTDLAVDLALDRLADALRAARPPLIFNLVEAIDDSGMLVPLATGVLDHLRLPYTGAGTAALVLTSHKIQTKRWLRARGLPTPAWWDPTRPLPEQPSPGSWIVKPLWEDASIGMDDSSVVGDFSQVPARLVTKRAQRECAWFAESFIDGREINVAILAGADGPQVLPFPEIEFVDFPPDKPRIVGYAAKWQEDSFEYRSTPRRFLDPAREGPLCAELASMALACWDIFDLRGYARVDFRVDQGGQPWILEVNANPCISPDAGFAAALREAGIPYAEAIRRILLDALRDQPEDG